MKRIFSGCHTVFLFLFTEKTLKFINEYWIPAQSGRTAPSTTDIRKAFTDWQYNRRRKGKPAQKSSGKKQGTTKSANAVAKKAPSAAEIPRSPDADQYGTSSEEDEETN